MSPVADVRLPEIASFGLVVGVGGGESRPVALVGDAGGVGTRPPDEGNVLQLSGSPRAVKLSRAVSLRASSADGVRHEKKTKCV